MRGIAKIARQQQDAPARLAHPCGGVLGIRLLDGQVGDRHVRALAGIRDGDRPADAGIATGDQRRLAGEQALAAQMGDPDRTYLDFLIRQSARSKWTASVCEGALLLAAAGLLDGYEATTHWAFARCVTERFPKVTLVPGHPRLMRRRR